MPRRFTFRLDPVLEQRRRAEQDQQVVVATLERERLEAEGRLRLLQLGISDAKAELREQLGATGSSGAPRGVSLTGARLQLASSLHLTALAQQAALELAGAYKRLEVERSRLAKLMAARKAVELLREKRYEQWLADEARRERQELDELVVMRHARKELV